MKEKTPFQMPKQVLKDFRPAKRNYLFLKINATSEGAFFDNVLYYQQLSTALYQLSCYANNYLE